MTTTDLGAPALAEPDRRAGMAAHGLCLLGMLVPFGHLLWPLLYWQSQRTSRPAVAAHAREALNFNVTVTLVWLVAAVLVAVNAPTLGALVALVSWGAWVALTVWATVAAGSGRAVRYPLTWRLLQ